MSLRVVSHSMQVGGNFYDGIAAKTTMRTTLTLDDSLFADALALADPGMDKAELLRECVKAFIQRQAALRLAALGGAAPEIEAVPRRHLGVDRP